MVNEQQVENWFTYHPPTRKVPDPNNPGMMVDEPDMRAILAHQSIREAGLTMALTILRHTPSCPDQSAAIRKVREATWAANAAIACGGK